MEAVKICIVTAVLALINIDFSESHHFEYNDEVAVDGKIECPDRPVIVSPDGGIYSSTIFKYMMLMCVDDKLLPYRQRPYVQNYTRNHMLNTFTSASLPLLENIPKTCPVNEYISLVNGEIIYNDRTVSVCISLESCLEAFGTDKNIVISPFIQFVDIVANNVEKIKSTLKFHQFLVDSSERMISKYGGHFIKSNNIAKNVADLSFVGVHVRRKNIDPSVHSTYGVRPVQAEYYLKAMDYFRYQLGGVGNTVFLIVSDDMSWVGNNLLLNNDTFVVSHGGKNNPEFDLALLAHCNHMILDYGEFGLVAYTLGHQGTTVCTDVDKQVVRVFEKSPNWHFVNINKDGSVSS